MLVPTGHYLGWDGWHLQLGTLGQWAGSLFAGGALYVAARTRRAGRADKREAAERERRAQARLIGGDCEIKGERPLPSAMVTTWRVDIINSSSEPVSKVHLKVAMHVARPELSNLRIEPSVVSIDVGTVAGHRTDTRDVEFTAHFQGSPAVIFNYRLLMELEFTDRLGQRWHVGEDDRLVEIL